MRSPAASFCHETFQVSFIQTYGINRREIFRHQNKTLFDLFDFFSRRLYPFHLFNQSITYIFNIRSSFLHIRIIHTHKHCCHTFFLFFQRKLNIDTFFPLTSEKKKKKDFVVYHLFIRLKNCGGIRTRIDLCLFPHFF